MGVAVTHRVAAAFVDAQAKLWNVTEHDRVLAAVSVGNDTSCEEMWLAWRNGAVLVPAPSALARDGADLGSWLAARRVSVVSTVEGQLRAVAGVTAAAAAVQPTGAGEAVLVGYVVGDVDIADVRASVAEHMPHGIAARIVRLDALPTDEDGKLDRGALPWPPPGGDEVVFSVSPDSSGGGRPPGERSQPSDLSAPAAGGADPEPAGSAAEQHSRVILCRKRRGGQG